MKTIARRRAIVIIVIEEIVEAVLLEIGDVLDVGHIVVLDEKERGEQRAGNRPEGEDCRRGRHPGKRYPQIERGDKKQQPGERQGEKNHAEDDPDERADDDKFYKSGEKIGRKAHGASL